MKRAAVCMTLAVLGAGQSGGASFAATIQVDHNNATAQFFESPDSMERFRTAGMVFQVPAPGTDTRLTEVRFEFGGAPSGFNYRMRVYAFDAGTSRPTGTALYTSSDRVANAAGTVTFSGLAVDLQPATDYIAFLTTQDVVNDATNGVILLANNTDPYPDGNTWRLESTSTSDTATSEPWTEVAGFDLDFFAQFEAPNEADLSVEIIDNTGFAGHGELLTYNLFVDNAGPQPVTGADIEALIQAGLVAATWECLAPAGATCTATGNGDLVDTFGLPAGEGLVYSLEALVQGASEVDGITFEAMVTPPAMPSDPDLSDNVAVDFNRVGLFADGFESAS